MKLHFITSCALLALAGCASSVATQDNQPAARSNEVYSYSIPAVYFDFNSVELTDTAKQSLYESIRGIENRNEVELVITGYADMYGNEAVNKTVSKKRAESVKAYLNALSIPAENMEVQAKGKSELRTTDPDAQDGERRVEVEIATSAEALAAAAAAHQAAADQNAADAAARKAAEDEARAKAAKKAAEDADSKPWYSVFYDCMCED